MTDVIIDTVKLDQLIKDSPEMVDKAIRATAFDATRMAQNLAPYDTGALKASIFTSTSKESGFGAAMSAAEAKNPDVEINDPTPPGKPPLMTAYVAPGVNYAYWIEFGTGVMSAQPFLTTAIEPAAETFVAYMKEVFKDGAW